MLGVRDILKMYNIRALKELSQNFILNEKVTDRMVRKISSDLTSSFVVEIGAGPGLLTRSLLKAGAKSLLVIEKDERFLPALQVG